MRHGVVLEPQWIDAELTNLALKKARRHPALATQMLVSLETALNLPLTRVVVPGVEVFALAAATGLTAYDASYLWLARTRDVELVTLDRALGRVIPA